MRRKERRKGWGRRGGWEMEEGRKERKKGEKIRLGDVGILI